MVKGRLTEAMLQWESGPKGRAHETDYFRDQRTKQLMQWHCPEKSNSFWSFLFSFTMLSFRVIKISSILSFKAVTWHSWLTQRTWEQLFLACFYYGAFGEIVNFSFPGLHSSIDDVSQAALLGSCWAILINERDGLWPSREKHDKKVYFSFFFLYFVKIRF